VVTIDADTVMHPDALLEVDRLVGTGKYVGGGCRFVLERNSLGLAVTTFAVTLATTLSRTGGVVYWCSREDFDAIGGFDEARRFRNLRDAPATVSVRKFDTFGD